MSFCLRIGSWKRHTCFASLGSKLILSNNQSRATLWVLETCLRVGRLPMMIIVITASLSSKMYNIAPLWEEVTFEETCLWETCVLHCEFTRFSDALPCKGLLRACLTFCFWFEFECITSITKSQRSSAEIPSLRQPASREIISDFVELCDTHVCVLHNQLIGTNVWLPNTHNVPPEVDFESSRSPAKESWKSPNLHCLAVFPTWQHFLYSRVKWM